MSTNQMDVSQALATKDRKATFQAAWMFVLFNVLFRDVHQLFHPGMLENMMTDTVTDQTLLLAGIGLQIPISMIVLSRALNYRASRRANIVTAAISIPLFLTAAPTDPDDWFFTGLELVALALIIWFAWRWRPSARIKADD